MAADPGFWVGPPGSLVKLPQPQPGVGAARELLGSFQAAGAGAGGVRQITGRRSSWRLGYGGLTPEEMSTLDYLREVVEARRIIDSNNKNYLTPNQSTGTDADRDTSGILARFQGTGASSSAQRRTGARSLLWDVGGAIGAANRGVYFYGNDTTPDATWPIVIPSKPYSFSAYARTNLASASMYAAIDWYTGDWLTETYLGTDFGPATTIGNSGWTRLLCENKTSPATVTYGIPAVLSAATTGSDTDVWVDDAQLEQDTAASLWVPGLGTPFIAVEQVGRDYPQAGYYAPELTLIEVA